MIKPLDNSIAMSRPTAFNSSFCAAPTVYENTLNYQPLGQKLNVECSGCKKPTHLGQKLDYKI